MNRNGRPGHDRAIFVEVKRSALTRTGARQQRRDP